MLEFVPHPCFFQSLSSILLRPLNNQFPVPIPKQHPAASTEQSVPGTKQNKRGDPRKKKGKRGGNRHGKTRYPEWLKAKQSGVFHAIFLLQDDVKNTQLADLNDPGRTHKYLFPVPTNPRLIKGVPFKIRRFALVTKEEVFSLNRKTPEDVNAYFLSNLNDTVELMDIGNATNPTRIFLCSDEDFSLAMSMKGMIPFTFEGIQYVHRETDQSINLLPGVCVSIWFCEDGIVKRFTLQDGQMVQDRFGSFYAGRCIVPCGGTNGYVGVRYSSRARPSPPLGPGTVVTGSYFRQHYSQDQMQPIVQAKMFEAARDAKTAVLKKYSTYLTFVGLNTGGRVIWGTMGKSWRNTTALTRGGVIVSCKSNTK
jgi:hypothetical protein